MGLAASQARLLMLTARADNLEFRGENLAEQREVIANETEQLFAQEEFSSNSDSNVNSYPTTSYPEINFNDIMKSVGNILHLYDDGFMKGVKNFLSSGSSTAQTQEVQTPLEGTIDQKIAELEEVDKKLELQLKQVDTQHQAVETEEQSVEKVIQKNIETTFNILG